VTLVVGRGELATDDLELLVLEQRDRQAAPALGGTDAAYMGIRPER
jgi:hypothetical protein